MNREDFAGRARGPVEIVFRQQARGAIEEARLAPDAIRLRAGSKEEPTATKAGRKRHGADCDAGRSELEPPAAHSFYPAPSADPSNMLCHRAVLIPESARDCNCAATPRFRRDRPELLPRPRQLSRAIACPRRSEPATP